MAARPSGRHQAAELADHQSVAPDGLTVTILPHSPASLSRSPIPHLLLTVSISQTIPSFRANGSTPSVSIIRPDTAAIDTLIAIDKAASTLFAPTGLLSKEALEDHVPAEHFSAAINAGWLFSAIVPSGMIAGFVMASIRGGGVYVDQLSVDPRHGRQGIGRTLMLYLEREARDRGFSEITLSTFRELAWNGPFYASLGYRHLKRSQFSSFMLDIEAAQRPFMDISKRTFMRKRLRRTIFRGRKPA